MRYRITLQSDILFTLAKNNRPNIDNIFNGMLPDLMSKMIVHTD